MVFFGYEGRLVCGLGRAGRVIGLVCSIKTYGKFSMGLNVLEGVLQGWDIDCFRAVPVEEAVFGWESVELSFIRR